MWKPVPAPQRDNVARDAFGDLVHRYDGAVRDIADRARLLLAEKLRANARTQTIGADQSGAF